MHTVVITEIFPFAVQSLSISQEADREGVMESLGHSSWTTCGGRGAVQYQLGADSSSPWLLALTGYQAIGL